MNFTQSPPYFGNKSPKNGSKTAKNGNFRSISRNFLRAGERQSMNMNNSNPFYLFFLWLLSDYNFSL